MLLKPHGRAANGNPDPAARAATQAGAVAVQADRKEEVEGIDRAMTSLNRTIATMEQRAEDAPNDHARQGMLTAADNMKGALNNMEQAKQRLEQAHDNSEQDDERANRTAGTGDSPER